MNSALNLVRRFRRSLIALAACVLSLLSWLVPVPQSAWADPLITRDPGTLDAFCNELQELQAKPAPLGKAASARLHDLEQLAGAIGDGDEAATVSNASSHNLGLFARYKKDSPDQAPQFYVLAPGHSSDDDYDALALYIPSLVSVNWEGATSAQVSPTPQVLDLLPGEALEVSDTPGEGQPGVGYGLNLPALILDSKLAGLPTLPQLNQQALDAEAETAPLD